MQRYFLEMDYHEAPFFLETENYHHAVHVMRMKVGDECYLVFKNGVAVVAEITEIQPEKVSLKEISREAQTKEMPIEITIACGFPKGDKLELVVQKGTELGAAAFVAFPAATSVVKWEPKKLAKKAERLQKIAKEAAEQAHRQRQPEVQLLDSFPALLTIFQDYDIVLVAYEEAAKQNEASHFKKALQQAQTGQRMLVIFGPEGGLAPQEVEKLQATGGILCGLGPRILRAETAPFYVLSAASYQWELA